MIFRSVCSGIEAASVAWAPLGWHADAFAEIDAFPSYVLAHHYPAVQNLGDITKFRDWPDAAFDLLVGGTPCQAFSVAGLRRGLADPRGNLTLVYLGILDRYRPRWMVWENVPGVLSDQGEAFGTFLGGLAELGYGFAYRVLDAQYIRVDGFTRAVPQRRRRVFVVGHLGDWRRAAAVLFERESLRGNPPPRREAGKAVASSITGRAGNGSRQAGANGNLIGFESATEFLPQSSRVYSEDGVAPALQSAGTRMGNRAPQVCAFGGNNQSGPIDVATAQTAHGGTGRIDFESETFVAHALRAEGFDASEDDTGRGTLLVPICFDETQITSKTNRCNPQPGDASHPLASGARPPTLAFHARQDQDSGPVTHPLDTDGSSIGIFANWRVRRLTPKECARLQGFPDDYLDITYRGKPAADGPKYKALGNSMAVNVMRWIGLRIALVDAVSNLVAAE